MSALNILLEVSVYSIVLFAVIMLVKIVFKKQFSPSMQYFIWFLLIARLLLPLTFESGVVLFTLPQQVVQETQSALFEDDSAKTAPLVPSSAQALPAQSAADGAQTPQAPAAPLPKTPKTPVSNASVHETSAPVPPIPWETLFISVWIAGMVIVGGATLCNYIRLAQKLKKTSVSASAQTRREVDRVCRALNIRRRLPIRVQRSIDSPALTASLFPKLLLPLSLLQSTKHLDFALRHELTHFKRGDYLVCILLLILRTVYWFNPIVWLMQRNVKTDMEFACDNMAAASLPSCERKEYAQTVLTMFSGRRSQQPVLGMSLEANRRTAEKRIRGIFMRHSTKNGIRIVCVLLCAALFAACFTTACTPVQEIYPGITSTQKFGRDAFVGGVDVSGMTFEEGRSAVASASEKMLGDQRIMYVVGDTERQFTHLPDEAGVEADVISALKQAMTNGGNVPLEFTVDETKLGAMIASDSAGWTSPHTPREVNVSSDETALSTSAVIDTQPSAPVFHADAVALAEEIKKQAATGTFSSFSVPGTFETVAPTLMGDYTTSFPTSAPGRRFNIWKGASLMNGITIAPGETWSMNEVLGPLTYERGWKGAPGIVEGRYEQAAGGGVDQVSSTLYLAALMSELVIVERSQHTWPLDYTPGGLDATITTGGSDLKLNNPYNVPIYLLASCDGDAQTLRIQIYGPGFEDGLTRAFFSELSPSSDTSKETKYLYDPAVPEGQEETVQPEHPRREFIVYKQYLDTEGNVIQSEPFATEIYEATPTIVRTGDAAKAG